MDWRFWTKQTEMLSLTSNLLAALETPESRRNERNMDGKGRQLLGCKVAGPKPSRVMDDESFFALPGLVEQQGVSSVDGSIDSASSQSSRRCLHSSSWPWIEGRNATQWSAHGLSVPSETPELDLCTSSQTHLLDKERSIIRHPSS
ncbi:hypothetical protein PLESTF_001875400 [Pleodorina starrii]|nr:hypothetical protein PLESTF_001875400 [Pleodorina starrii]